MTVKFVLQIIGLRSEDLYRYLIEECDADDYLPGVKHGLLPNIQWHVKVGIHYSLIVC